MSYKRILLKLSGEALMGQGSHGIDPQVIQRLAAADPRVRGIQFSRNFGQHYGITAP